jgi:hypothetical protein
MRRKNKKNHHKGYFYPKTYHIEVKGNNAVHNIIPSKTTKMGYKTLYVI